VASPTHPDERQDGEDHREHTGGDTGSYPIPGHSRTHDSGEPTLSSELAWSWTRYGIRDTDVARG